MANKTFAIYGWIAVLTCRWRDICDPHASGY